MNQRHGELLGVKWEQPVGQDRWGEVALGGGHDIEQEGIVFVISAYPDC